MEHATIVKDIYAAFGAGDIPTILDHLSPDVEWEPGMIDHGVPWLSPGGGTDHVLSFFQAVGENLEMTKFEPVGIFDAGNDVLAIIDVECSVRPTGMSVSGREVHHWTFTGDGKVASLRHYLDTHQHVLAAGV